MSFVNHFNTLAKGAPGAHFSNAASELVLLVELLPPSAASNYQSVGARLSVGGNFIPILSFEETVSATGASKTVSVSLARVEDKSLLAPGAEFLIETVEQNAPDEEPVWETALTGKITAKTLTVSNADGKPNDAVTFTAESRRRLQKAPNRNLVIFDADRADIDASEFEPVYDTYGRAYTLDTLNVPNLSLYKLFDEIFVNRCGFASVETNLPDYPIRRADFSLFESYYNGVKQFIGVFDAILTQTADNRLFVTDATLALPAGFPAPRLLQAAKIQSIQSETAVENIECFELQFSMSETGEFFTTKNETFNTEVKTRFGDLISKIVRKIKTRQYRSNYARRIVLREVVEKKTTEVYGADSIFPSAITTETFEFDAFGRQSQSIKTVEKRMPDMTSGGLVSLREVSNDELKHFYAVFPFAARRQFLKRTELIQKGIIAIDSENQYLGEDFPQDLTLAHRGGGLKDSTTEADGVLKSVVEEFTPLPDGTVRVQTTKIDHVPEFVGREAIVEVADDEPRAGDISVSGNSTPGKIYVLAKDTLVLTDQERVPFAVGELPLYLAVPLARRRLKNQSKPKLRIELGLWDKTLVQGVVCRAMGRSGEAVNLIVEGYRRFCRISNGALEWGMSLEGEEI